MGAGEQWARGKGRMRWERLSAGQSQAQLETEIISKQPNGILWGLKSKKRATESKVMELVFHPKNPRGFCFPFIKDLGKER